MPWTRLVHSVFRLKKNLRRALSPNHIIHKHLAPLPVALTSATPKNLCTTSFPRSDFVAKLCSSVHIVPKDHNYEKTLPGRPPGARPLRIASHLSRCLCR